MYALVSIRKKIIDS
jgi:hypothetical protein